MRAHARTIAFALALLGLQIGAAHAGPFDLDDDDDTAKKADPKKPAAQDPLKDMPAAPVATIKPHAYTLEECLTLADRNHPNLWAARARLAFVHAQLDEAKTTPFSLWSTNATFGVLPQLGGTPFYNAVPRQILNQGIGAGYEPFLQFSLRGTIPIYTFGKIDSIKRAAEANIRVTEWDLEKTRQSIRMDVRRAYFGLMLAHDAIYIAGEVVPKLDSAIEGIQKKLDKNEGGVEEPDRLRLEISRDEVNAKIAEARKGAAYASAALRFLTGVQSAFDIPDEPLKRPEQPLGPVVRYLTAARLFRADVNQARIDELLASDREALKRLIAKED